MITRKQWRLALKHARQHFCDPGVHCIAVGAKKVAGLETEAECLVFYVEKKTSSLADSPPGYQIPKVLQIPAVSSTNSFEVATDVIEQPQKQLSVGVSGTSVRCGGSISVGGKITGVVRDNYGRTFILSNSHVLTDFGRWGIIGNSVKAGGQHVARLSRFTPLYPGSGFPCDAALAELIDPTWNVETGVPLNGTAHTWKNGDPVFKVASTGVVTHGVIAHWLCDFRVSFPPDTAGWCSLTGQIAVSNMGVPGDSGSLVLDQTGRALGIFTADDPSRSIDGVCPMGTALRALQDPNACATAIDDRNYLSLNFV